MVGGGEVNIIPYAIELKANNFETGLLSSLANLFGPFAQILGSRLVEKYHRKKIVLIGVVFQALSCFIFSLLGFIFLNYDKNVYLVPLVILAYVSYHLSGSFSGPAWFSLMGDVVPEKIRGKYFSRRNKISGIFSVSATLISSLIIYYFQRFEIIYGFIIVFSIAGLARLISAYLLNKHHVEKMTFEPGHYFSLWQFTRKIRHYNFNLFTLYVSHFRMATTIAGPFFAVYMWKVLGLNPFWFAAVNISAGVFSFLFFPVWGKFADKYGNRELLRISSIILVFVPLFWIFNTNPIYLILIPQFISGAGWSGFNLSASNFIYDSTKPQRRAMMVAYYNLFNGVGIFSGALIGGLITQYLSVDFINAFIFVFIISSFVTLMSIIFLLPTIKEVRESFHPGQKNPLNYLREIKPVYETTRYTMYPIKKFISLTGKIKIYRKNRITYY